MNAADIERMAREAGALDELIGAGYSTDTGLVFLDEGAITPSYPSLIRFAALVEAAAMERAAKIADG